MVNRIQHYRTYLFLSIILISIGVTLINVPQNTGALGVVFIAIGGLFFMIGMHKKKNQL